MGSYWRGRVYLEVFGSEVGGWPCADDHLDVVLYHLFLITFLNNRLIIIIPSRLY